MIKNLFKYSAIFIPAIIVFLILYLLKFANDSSGYDVWMIWAIFFFGIIPFFLILIATIFFVFMFKAFRNGTKGSSLLKHITLLLILVLSVVSATVLLSLLG